MIGAKTIFPAVALSLSHWACAEQCKEEWQFLSTALRGIKCLNPEPKYRSSIPSIRQIRFKDKIIYSTPSQGGDYVMAPVDYPEGVIIFMMGDNENLACHSHLMLIDARGSIARAYDFGISHRCSEPSQSFWSKKKGVEKGTIILKPDVKFTYKDGKLMPPDDPYPATQVVYTSDRLFEEAKKLGFPGAYVHEIPLR